MSEETDIMKVILELLFRRCGFESVVNYDCSKLWFSFHFGGMMLEIECNNDSEEKYCFKRVGDVDINEFCQDVKVGKLYITAPAPYTEDTTADYDVSWKMFQMVKIIKSINPTAVKDYYVRDFLMDPYIMEGENIWYSYFIEIADDLKRDLQFISAITDLLDNHQTETSFNELIFKGIDITPKYELKHLTTNTKVRRLGYFKGIISLFKDNPILLERPLLKKIGETATEYEDALLHYKNAKGVIKQTKNGSGARPYVEAAQGMNLITKVGNGYELGKVSRAYNAFPCESISPFELDVLDKAFFLETILRYDYLYIFTLLEYAFTAQCPSYRNLKREYQQLLLKNLQLMKEAANRADSIKKYNIQTAERRIGEWKKPEVYLEHVLMPRLNWLFDLDLIVLHDNLSFGLTVEGVRLFSAICGWRDLEGLYVVDSAPYLDAMFMKIFSYTYDSDKFVRLQDTDVDSLLTSYLEESFNLFKTFARNRVTFSVFVNYAKWRLYKDEHVAIDTDDIKNNFLKQNTGKYVFKFQKFYNDGYIQKLK